MKIVCLKDYLIESLKEAFPDSCICNKIDCEADIFIGESSQCTKEILSQMPHLQYVQTARAGYDKADLNYLQEKNIVFCNAKGLYSIPIAEDIVNKILIYTNNTLSYMRQQENKTYEPIQKRRCISSLCVGFLGTGSIAQEAARKLHPFDCRIIGYKRKSVQGLPNFDKLYYGEELSLFLSEADILVVTVDLNKKTYHMLNDETFKLMKTHSAIINIARGEVIDEEALIHQLKTGKINYAALDVFEQEPLPKESELWNFSNVYLTPHASGICEENHDRLLRLVKENIDHFLKSEQLINVVLDRKTKGD